MAIKIAGTTVIDDNRNITTNVGTIKGRDMVSDGQKLDGIAAGATGNQTASQMMAAIRTVGGSGSDLDADKLDGRHGSEFLQLNTAGSYNINSALATGIYAGSTGDFTNRGPSGHNGGALLNINTHSGNYYSQLWFDTNGNNFYHRSADNDSTPSATWDKVWTSGNDGANSGLDADLLDGQHGSYYTGYTDTAISNLIDSSPGTLNTLNELAAALGDDASFSTTVTNSIATKLPLSGGTMTGSLTIDTGSNSSDALVIRGETPTISFIDQTSGADDFYIHINNHNFYVLRDTAGANLVGTGWDNPHPLSLEGDTNIGYVFGSRMFHETYHPNADKWTTARTLSLSGQASGSVSWDGSANATLNVTLSDTALDDQYMDKNFQDSGYINFTVDGDADTYYPVSIQNGGSYAYQMYSISRGYNWTAPSTWNTSSHKGGLTFTWQFPGDGFWGGNDKDIRVIKWDETYTTIVGGIGGSVGGGGTHAGVVLWLRGGGATYRFHGPAGELGDVNVHLTAVTASNGTVFAPRTSASSAAGEILPKYPIRNSSDLYDGNNRVWHAGNDGSGSGLDADFLDGVQGSSYLRSDTSDTFTTLTGTTLNVTGTTTLGNGNNDVTNINDTLKVYATDSGDSHFYFGENSSSGYGTHWYWDSGHTHTWYSRHAGTDTAIMSFDTRYTKLEMHRELDMNNNDIVGVNNIFHEGDSNTYMGFHNADQWRVVTGGTERLEINSDNAVLAANLKINSHNIDMDLNNVGINAIDMEDVRVSTWPLNFTTNAVGNDNESGFWVGSNGYPDMRLRRENGTVRVRISSWEQSFVSNGFRVDGDTDLNGNVRVDRQDTISTTTPGKKATYGMHFGGLVTSTRATGITFGADTSNGDTAQAGLYVQGSGSYGTKMYLATTDSYATGAKTAISIDHLGKADFARQTPTVSGNTVWHAGNDGAGSGLDADLLDGKHASSFTEIQATFRSGATNFDSLKTSGFHSLYNANASGHTNAPFQYGAMISAGNTAASGGMAMQIAHERTGTGTYIRGMNDSSDTWWPWREIWTSGTDGAGSGLDADLLDGVQGSSYLRSDTPDTISATNGGPILTVSKTGSAPGNGSAQLVYNQYSNHSWGITSEFRNGSASGTDRPSILFSTEFNTHTWSVGFGLTDSNFRIKTDHGHRNQSWGTTQLMIDRSGNTSVTGNVTAYYSDMRLKTKVSNIENALDKVNSLEGFYYVENQVARDHGFTNEDKQVALSAQSVQSVLPEAVSSAPFDIETDEEGNKYSKSGEDYLTVDYARLVPLLVEAIKELKQEINELKEK